MIADIRPALFQFLMDDPNVSAAVGGERVFPNILPQGIREPSVVYNRVSGLGDHHMQGPSGLTRPRFQIDAYAEDSDTASNLADLVKERLDGFRGMMGTVKVQGVFFDTEREDYHDNAKLFRVSRDYLFWYEEQ